MTYITLGDYLLLPIYLFVIYKLVGKWRDKFYPSGHPLRRYVMPALSLKIAGAIMLGIIYQYYYGSGDTFEFFTHGKIINKAGTESTAAWFRLFFHNATTDHPADAAALGEMYWYDDVSAYTVSRISALLALISCGKYLIINVILAVISFTGLWSLYITYAAQYRNLYKPLAFVILFVPSLAFWGSGLLKDTICISCLGWMTYTVFMAVKKRKVNISTFFLFALSVYLLFLIKSYILITFLPFLLLNIILTLFADLKKKRVQLILIFGLVFYGGYKLVSDQLQQFQQQNQTEKLLEEMKRQKDYLLRVSQDQDGTTYDIGDFEPTVNSVVSKALPAMNVTLFRPYIWEARKPMLILNAIEALATLLFTVWILVTANPFKTLRTIFTDPNLILLLGFTLCFAFIVGITSFNFGALSRYKIPCVPFYLIFLVVLHSKMKKQTTEHTNQSLEYHAFEK